MQDPDKKGLDPQHWMHILQFTTVDVKGEKNIRGKRKKKNSGGMTALYFYCPDLKRNVCNQCCGAETFCFRSDFSSDFEKVSTPLWFPLWLRSRLWLRH
jgi:hypothetical protein